MALELRFGVPPDFAKGYPPSLLLPSFAHASEDRRRTGGGQAGYGSIFADDCIPKSVGNTNEPLVGRAIFEFPRGSGRYFNFFNTHISLGTVICDEAPNALVYVRERNLSLEDELEQAGFGVDGIYPPVFAGDFNSKTVSNCDEETQDWICFWFLDDGESDPEHPDSQHFKNAPNPDIIDKVLVGLLSGWLDYGSSLDLDISIPYDSDEEAYPLCTSEPYGYRFNEDCEYDPPLVDFDTNPYSDHSPSMVDIMAIQGP